MMKRLLFLVILSLILGCSLVSAYQVGPAEESNILTPTRVVFLEHSLIANGTVTSGTMPFRSVDFPNYWFNENTRQLNGNIDFPLNDSLLAIFGDSLTLKGNFGAGTGNKLYGIYHVPLKADQATIYSIDQSGTIGLYVNNQSLYLRPGENYSYNQTETVKEKNGTARVIYSNRYVNRGLLDKTAIATRMIP